MEAINKEALACREDNYFWKPKSVLGVGPTRSYYFLSKEVVAGARSDGFHRTESALKGTVRWQDDFTQYVEFPGFTCANREFMVSSIEIMSKLHLNVVAYTNRCTVPPPSPCRSGTPSGPDLTPLASTHSLLRHDSTTPGSSGLGTGPNRSVTTLA